MRESPLVVDARSGSHAAEQWLAGAERESDGWLAGAERELDGGTEFGPAFGAHGPLPLNASRAVGRNSDPRSAPTGCCRRI